MMVNENHHISVSKNFLLLFFMKVHVNFDNDKSILDSYDYNTVVMVVFCLLLKF